MPPADPTREPKSVAVPALVEPSGLPSVPAVSAEVVRHEAEAAAAFARAEKADATRRAYRSDWRRFEAWCASRGTAPLPAAPEAVAAFLAAEAAAGTKPSTLARRAAAIRYAHRLAGHESPTNAEAVRATLRGIRRTLGAAPAQKAPATASRIAAMAALAPAGTLRGLRDRALLLLGFAGAFRRSELVALRVEDLVETPDGLRIVIRRSKTDQEGAGQEVAIPHGARLRWRRCALGWTRPASLPAPCSAACARTGSSATRR